MIPVKGYIGLYRDETSNAIINSNDKEYNEYIQSRNRLIENQNKIQKIEQDISEIKSLLKMIIENK
jgi:hypothetical protein